MAGPAVEPDEHGRVGDHRVEQPGEAAERSFAQRLDLRGQGCHAINLRQAGGEVAVPEERQPLAERVAAEEHPIEPVSPQPSRIARRRRPPRGGRPGRHVPPPRGRAGLRNRPTLSAGPAATSRSSSARVAPKPARRWRWATLRRSHGSSGVGTNGAHAVLVDPRHGLTPRVRGCGSSGRRGPSPRLA